MLMAYFTLNAHNNNAHQYTYYQLPEHYGFDHQTRSWHKRRLRHDTIARMYTVHPKDGERYMLRVLLMHVTGAKGFEELRTYKGIIYPSFWAAAQARGLLTNDAEWINCLREANALQHPRHLRYLFAMILCCCSPSDPKKLWTLYANDLSADFLYKVSYNHIYHNKRKEHKYSPSLDEQIPLFVLLALHLLMILLYYYLIFFIRRNNVNSTVLTIHKP